MIDYKKLALMLCDGFQDMPCGCDGCPLGADMGRLDEKGNYICPLHDHKVDDEVPMK